MKIQIDTEAKVIKIEEKVNLGELIEKLNLLLPEDLWKEYTLEPTIINNWNSPIIIDYPKIVPNIQPITYPFTPNDYPYTPQPVWYQDKPFWSQQIITYGTSNVTIDTTKPIYNVQI